MKKYSNYSEQVEDNVEDLELFNDLNKVDEFWYEALLDTLSNVTSDKTVFESLDKETQEENPIESEGFYELRDEYIFESLDSVYQIYKVKLKGGEFTLEHERLMIFWNDIADSYILPVFHFGTSWSMVPPTRDDY